MLQGIVIVPSEPQTQWGQSRLCPPELPHGVPWPGNCIPRGTSAAAAAQGKKPASRPSAASSQTWIGVGAGLHAITCFFSFSLLFFSGFLFVCLLVDTPQKS